MDSVMLRQKEIQDRLERETEAKKKEDSKKAKEVLQAQIAEAQKIKEEAHQQYLREKEQVDNVIQRMIDEDREMARI